MQFAVHLSNFLGQRFGLHFSQPTRRTSCIFKMTHTHTHTYIYMHYIILHHIVQVDLCPLDSSIVVYRSSAQEFFELCPLCWTRHVSRLSFNLGVTPFAITKHTQQQKTGGTNRNRPRRTHPKNIQYIGRIANKLQPGHERFLSTLSWGTTSTWSATSA